MGVFVVTLSDIFTKRQSSGAPGIFHDKKSPKNAFLNGGNEMWIFDDTDSKSQYISSTKIRSTMEKLRKNGDVLERSSALQKLVDEDILAKSTATYMNEHWDTLFLAPLE